MCLLFTCRVYQKIKIKNCFCWLPPSWVLAGSFAGHVLGRMGSVRCRNCSAHARRILGGGVLASFYSESRFFYHQWQVFRGTEKELPPDPGCTAVRGHDQWSQRVEVSEATSQHCCPFGSWHVTQCTGSSGGGGLVRGLYPQWTSIFKNWL